MSSPRHAREHALRMLFQWEMSRENPDRAYELYWTIALADTQVRGFANLLFRGVIERREEIDELIREHSAEDWRIERLSGVDRNILRVAIFELMSRREVSPAIIISEAVEIAAIYSTDASAQFINAALESVSRKIREAE